MKNLLLFPLLFILSSLFVSCGDDDDNIIMPDEMTISPVSGIYDESGNIIQEFVYDIDGNLNKINYKGSNGETVRTQVWTRLSNSEYTKDLYLNGGNDYYITDSYKRTADNDVIKTRYNKNTDVVTFIQRQVFGDCGDTAVYDVDKISGNEKLLLSREYSNDCLTEVTTYPNGNTITIKYDGRLWYNNAVYAFDFYNNVYVEKGNILSTVIRDSNGNITDSSSSTYEYNSEGFVTKITSTDANGTITVRTIKY